jgi:hypothetical protein
VPPSRPTGPATPAAASAEEALRFAETLARSCSHALGEQVAGVILHGSLTLADYLPCRSDVDLLVVVDHPLGDAQLAALVEVMASRRAEAPGVVDLRLVTWQVAASPIPAPPLEAYLRLTPGSGVRLEERRHPGSATWWWSSRSAARTAAACWGRRFAEEGRHASKVAAAEWALRRDPTLGVVADALRRRHGDRPARSTPPRFNSCWGWFGHGLPGRAAT